MNPCRILAVFAFTAVTSVLVAAAPQLPGIGAAMQAKIDQREVSGAVTVVLTRDKIVHLESTGVADLATRRPIAPDSLFWIASMSKPITGVAVLLLQDEGKLNVNDPVAKFIPEFAQLKTPSGKPANLTITQILTQNPGLLASVLSGGGAHAGESACPNCTGCGHCVSKRTDAVRSVVASTPGGVRLAASLGVGQVPADIAKLIDHTLLKAEATYADIDKLCDEAKKFGFASVCVNPLYVKRAADNLRGAAPLRWSPHGSGIRTLLDPLGFCAGFDCRRVGTFLADMVLPLVRRTSESATFSWPPPIEWSGAPSRSRQRLAQEWSFYQRERPSAAPTSDPPGGS